MTDDNETGTPAEPEGKAIVPGAEATPAEADNTENAATSEQTDANDAGADKPEGEGEAEKPKPKAKGGFQKRISELTREREEKAREAAYWREAALNGVKSSEQKQAQADPDAPPKADDFDSYEDYITAKARHTVQQELKREAEQRQRQEGEAKFNEVQTQFAGRLEKASEVYADFDDAMENLQGLNAHPMVATALMQSDKGVDVLYWLGTNPEEAARIHKMHPLAQVKEIGRIEATLSQPAARKVTQAKAPPTTLKGGGTAKKDPNSMSMDEYVAWRTANSA